MVWIRAVLFSDNEVAERALTTTNKMELHYLKHAIKGFDEGRWVRAKPDLMHNAMREKFLQNNKILGLLFSTGFSTITRGSSADHWYGPNDVEIHLTNLRTELMLMKLYILMNVYLRIENI